MCEADVVGLVNCGATLRSGNKNHGRFYFDEEFVACKARHPNPRCTRWFLAENRLQSVTDGISFMHVALLDVKAQRADLIEPSAD